VNLPNVQFVSATLSKAPKQINFLKQLRRVGAFILLI